MDKFFRFFPTLGFTAMLLLASAGCTAGLKAAWHLRRANADFAAGKFDQAAIEYQNVIHLDPSNPSAWAHLGIIYFRDGRLADIAPILQRAAALNSNDLEVRLDLGSIYLLAGQLKQARDQADFVLARDPANQTAPILLADTAVTNADVQSVRRRLQRLAQSRDTAPLEVALGTLAFTSHDTAIAQVCFKRAIALDPKFADAYSALGNLYLALKDPRAADPTLQQAAVLAPPRSGKQLQYAQFKIMTGDAEAGEKLLRQMTAQIPDYLPGWMALARLQASQTNYDACAISLGNVLSRDPSNFEALLLDGTLLIAQGKTTQGIDQLQHLEKLYPQSPRVCYQLALAYFAGQQPLKAASMLNQALTFDPQFPDAILLQSQIEVQSGNAASAIPALNALIGRQPDLVPAHLLLAAAYRATGSPSRAIQIYRQLSANDPKNPQYPALIGVAALDENDDASARKAFDQALQLAPDYLPAVSQLVNLDLVQKRYADALQRVQPLARQNPASPTCQLLLANVLSAQGATSQAETTLENAIKASPDSQSLYMALAQLYLNVRQDQKALADLRAALLRNPTNSTALTLEGTIYNNAKDYQRASAAYEKVLAFDPANGIALNNLACIVAAQSGGLDKAWSLADKAHRLYPSDASIADTLGWILSLQGKYATALTLLQQSAAAIPASPEIQFHLGMAYYKMGNAPEAKSSFQTALKLNQPFPEINECRQYLDVLNINPLTAGPVESDLLNKTLAAQPDDPIALDRLAAIYQRRGDRDKAIAAYIKAIKANSSDVKAMVNLAELYAMRSSTLQQALDLATKAGRMLPNDPRISLLLGRIAWQTGDYSLAFNELEQAVQQQPGDADALFDLAQAAYAVGKTSDAQSVLRHVLSSHPSPALAAAARQHLNLIVSAENPAQALASESQINEILNARPNNAPALMVKAVIARQKSGLPAAGQIYQQILAHHPNFAPAQRQSAILSFQNPANDQQTYAICVRARAAYPNDPLLAKILGVTIYRTAKSQADFVRAASLLTRGLQAGATDAETFYYLGMAQFQAQHPIPAKANLQHALGLGLPGPLATAARRTLAGIK